MAEITYNLLKDKAEKVGRRVSELLEASGANAYDVEPISELEPLKIVFAGQYSAGKSSLIKMLTGIESIRIGAGVTTDKVSEYHYKSLAIWDTPGILAGECEQHDAKALQAISRADLLVYVITNELFDDVVGKAFRDLCFKQGRAKEIMLVINKSGNDSAARETKLSGIAPVLEPKIPEDFPIVFTDAQSFFDALEEDDEEERQELMSASNRNGFICAIDEFVSQRGIYSRLTTPLQQLQQALESRLDDLTLDDPLKKGVVSLLTQNKRIFLANRRDLVKKIQASIENLNSQFIERGNQLADALGEDQEEFEKAQDRIQHECEELAEKTLKELQGLAEEALGDLEKELIDLANTPASIKVKEALDSARNFELSGESEKPGAFSKDNPLKLNNAFSQGILKSSEKGFSFLAKSAIGDASKTGLKSVTGSTLHTAVKEIGGFFGYKFKAWEAIKIADKIGKGAKFLGPAMAIFGVGMQLLDDYNQAEHEKKIKQTKRDIRKSFREYGESVRKAMDSQAQALLEIGFDKSIINIDEALSEIRAQAENNSENTSSLRAQLSEIEKLRQEIQRAN